MRSLEEHEQAYGELTNLEAQWTLSAGGTGATKICDAETILKGGDGKKKQ